jgi:hypothetical protein
MANVLNATPNLSNPVQITTSVPHGLTTGDSVLFAEGWNNDLVGSGGWDWTVTVTGLNTFTIEYDNTGGVLSPGIVVLSPYTALFDQAAFDSFFPCIFTQLEGWDGLVTQKNLLSMLAGRGYQIAKGTTLYGPITIGGASGIPCFLNEQGGDFTFVDTKAGLGVPNPTTTPIVVSLPVKPIRNTYATASFNMSITQGALKKLASGVSWNFHGVSFVNSEFGAAGVATTLSGQPIRSYPYQGARANLKGGFYVENPGINAVSPASEVRLVTVYDDSGNVLV